MGSFLPPPLLTNCVQRSVRFVPSCARWLNLFKKLFCQIDRGGRGGKGARASSSISCNKTIQYILRQYGKYPICQKSGEAPSSCQNFENCSADLFDVHLHIKKKRRRRRKRKKIGALPIFLKLFRPPKWIMP